MCGFVFRRHWGVGRRVGVNGGACSWGQLLLGMEGLLR